MKYHTINILTVLVLTLLLVSGCGDPPPDMPSPPENVGDVVISCSVKLSPDSIFYPNEIRVIIDGMASPGFVIGNPGTIRDVAVSFHWFDISFRVNDLVTAHHGFGAEVFFNQVTSFPLEFEAGTIELTGRIDPDSPAIPDSIGVLLDDDSLEYHGNPLTIPGILTGSHTIITYCVLDSAEYIGTAEDIAVTFDSVTDVNILLSTGGVVVVRATSSGADVDSFKVVLGGRDFGRTQGPRTFSNITPGLFRLEVWAEDDTTETLGWTPEIEVVASETTRVTLEMKPVSPFAGYYAPEIVVTDIDGNNYSLMDHWGAVIYLYFFEHT